MNTDIEHTASTTVATTNSDLVDTFLGGLKATTVRAYRSDLAQFAAYLEAPTAEHATQLLLEAGHGNANRIAHEWRSHMLDIKQLSPATVNRRLSALKSLITMANRVGIVPWTLSVQSVKARPYRDTAGPGRETIEAMIRLLEEGGGKKAARDLAIIRLLFERGLRRGEVVALDLEDIDIQGRRVRVLGKGQRDPEWLTIAGPTATALQKWLRHRDDKFGPMFTSMGRGRAGTGRLSGGSVARIVRAVGDSVGHPGVHPHGLRHTAITEVLDRTDGNVRSARRFSRHAKLETLMVYDDNAADVGGEMADLIAVV